MMTHRERALATLDRQPTDRVALDLTHHTFIPETLQKLQLHLCVKDPNVILDHLGVDFRWVSPVWNGPLRAADAQGLSTSVFGTDELVLLAYGDSLEDRALARAETAADVERFPWPEAAMFDFDPVRRYCEVYRDYAIVGPNFWAPLYCRIADLCGEQRALVNLLQNPVVIDAMVERISHFYEELYTRTLEAGGGKIDILYTADDWTTQRGLLFSPELWRRFFREPFRRFFEIGKKYGARNMLHQCGSISPLLPDLIDMGLDIIMPTQVEASDMDPEYLKREFGKDLVFYGGVSVQQVLPFGTEADVRAEVRRLIDTLGKGGGYILAAGHNIQADTPLANILAMYEEAQSYSGRQ